MDLETGIYYIRNYQTRILALKSGELDHFGGASSSEAKMLAIASGRYDLISDPVDAWLDLDDTQKEVVTYFRSDLCRWPHGPGTRTDIMRQVIKEQDETSVD